MYEGSPAFHSSPEYTRTQNIHTHSLHSSPEYTHTQYTTLRSLKNASITLWQNRPYKLNAVEAIKEATSLTEPTN